MPAEGVVTLTGVRFCWPGTNREVLNIPRFEVRDGERLFIQGPSGSGKTTLLSLIGGIITPSAGAVTLLGRDTSAMKSADRDAYRGAHIGMIFQMFNLIPYLPLLENVILPCRFSSTRRQRALEQSSNLEQEARRLLSHLGLDATELSGRPVTELSAGQQQRTAAARALMGNPELIIADEPTSALDADARESFLKLLFNEARDRDSTILFVSHDAKLGGMFDRVVHIKEINHGEAGR